MAPKTQARAGNTFGEMIFPTLCLFAVSASFGLCANSLFFVKRYNDMVYLEDKLLVSFEKATFKAGATDMSFIIEKNDPSSYGLHFQGNNAKVVIAKDGIILYPLNEAMDKQFPSVQETILSNTISLTGGEMIYIGTPKDADDMDRLGRFTSDPSFDNIVNLSQSSNHPNSYDMCLSELLHKSNVAFDALVFINKVEPETAIDEPVSRPSTSSSSAVPRPQSNEDDFELTAEEWAMIARDLEYSDRKMNDTEDEERYARREDKVRERESGRSQESVKGKQKSDEVPSSSKKTPEPIPAESPKEEAEKPNLNELRELRFRYFTEGKK